MTTEAHKGYLYIDMKEWARRAAVVKRLTATFANIIGLKVDLTRNLRVPQHVQNQGVWGWG